MYVCVDEICKSTCEKEFMIQKDWQSQKPRLTCFLCFLCVSFIAQIADAVLFCAMWCLSLCAVVEWKTKRTNKQQQQQEHTRIRLHSSLLSIFATNVAICHTSCGKRNKNVTMRHLIWAKQLAGSLAFCWLRVKSQSLVVWRTDYGAIIIYLYRKYFPRLAMLAHGMQLTILKYLLCATL